MSRAVGLLVEKKNLETNFFLSLVNGGSGSRLEEDRGF